MQTCSDDASSWEVICSNSCRSVYQRRGRMQTIILYDNHDTQSQGAESSSVGMQGKHGCTEIFTYSQTDFLALSAWERWCQIHSFLCRRENAMQWQWAQNRTKRKCLNLGPFFHHLLFHGYGARELFSFANSFSFPPLGSLSPLCHFNRRIFTFRANPKGVSAGETRVQSITCFHWQPFRNYKYIALCIHKAIKRRTWSGLQHK